MNQKIYYIFPYTNLTKQWYDYKEAESFLWYWNGIYKHHKNFLKQQKHKQKHREQIRKFLLQYSIQLQIRKDERIFTQFRRFFNSYEMKYFTKFGNWPGEKQKYRHLPKSKHDYHYRYNSLQTSQRKLADKFQLTNNEYWGARRSWALIIRKENPFCVICGRKASYTHHIFYASLYPKLSLNLNNGVGLCLDHHKEVHLFDWFSINGS